MDAKLRALGKRKDVSDGDWTKISRDLLKGVSACKKRVAALKRGESEEKEFFLELHWPPLAVPPGETPPRGWNEEQEADLRAFARGRPPLDSGTILQRNTAVASARSRPDGR